MRAKTGKSLIGLLMLIVGVLFITLLVQAIPFGTPDRFVGADKPSSIEQSEHNNTMSTKNVSEVPSDMKKRFAYDGSNNPEYIGVAPKGTATSAAVWMIQKLAYTATYLYSIDIAYGSWDGRAALSYE